MIYAAASSGRKRKLGFTVLGHCYYIHEEFIQNSAQAEQKYLDQTLLVSGLVTAIDSKSLTIENKVYAQFETLNSDLNVNDSVTVKGRCIGFDDLLEEIKLDQCSIIK